MSFLQAEAPHCTERADDVELVIEPRSRDLGGFSVRRVLPAPDRMLVGPFIFFDEMGPARFPAGQGINVRPHPHIGLSTVTYLFEGEILHRDSLGYVQPIRPGAVNLMTAGRGIVHSERTSEALLASGQRLHGIQTWMALPEADEEMEPAFEHVPGDELPVIEADGVRGRVILGTAYGAVSPIATRIDTVYVDLELAAGASLPLPDGADEVAVYVVDGAVTLGGCAMAGHTMGVVTGGRRPLLRSDGPARIRVIGGRSPGPRHVWWNFVSSRRERIEQAKADWRDGRFAPVPGDDEFIPLPAR
ncbi:MAG TPA: pirin family protein [Pseudomonadales bacterium]|nr:pirin family protein [Pseudomonadales bacterium]